MNQKHQVFEVTIDGLRKKLGFARTQAIEHQEQGLMAARKHREAIETWLQQREGLSHELLDQLRDEQREILQHERERKEQDLRHLKQVEITCMKFLEELKHQDAFELAISWLERMLHSTQSWSSGAHSLLGKILAADGPLLVLKIFRLFLSKEGQADVDMVTADLRQDIAKAQNEKRHGFVIWGMVTFQVACTIRACLWQRMRTLLLRFTR